MKATEMAKRGLLEYFVSDQRILRGNDETKISLTEWRSNGLDTSIKKGKKSNYR